MPGLKEEDFCFGKVLRFSQSNVQHQQNCFCKQIFGVFQNWGFPFGFLEPRVWKGKLQALVGKGITTLITPHLRHATREAN